MEKVDLNYSTKNIPIPNRTQYKMLLVQKSRVFLRKLRWKTYFYLNPPKVKVSQENYGFKSDKNPPPVKLLKPFEDELISLDQNVKFKKHSKHPNEFQQKLSNDMKNIKESPDIIVKGDKTSNHFSVGKEKYKSDLNKAITSEYKKATAEKERQINLIDKN